MLEVGGGIAEVIATSGDSQLGGDDFDQVSGRNRLSLVLPLLWLLFPLLVFVTLLLVCLFFVLFLVAVVEACR